MKYFADFFSVLKNKQTNKLTNYRAVEQHEMFLQKCRKHKSARSPTDCVFVECDADQNTENHQKKVFKKTEKITITIKKKEKF